MTDQLRLMLGQAAAIGSAADMLRAVDEARRASTGAIALAPLEHALRRHPRDAQLWHALGSIHHSLEDYPSALPAYRKAADLAPDDADIALALARAAFESGLPAVDLFKRAMHLNPGDRGIRQCCAAALIEENRRDSAIAMLERELKRDPLWIEGQAALARVRWMGGDRKHFADGFERALAKNPREPLLWRAYVETLVHDELHERVLAVIDRARAAIGPDPGLDEVEAVSRTEMGDLAAAEQAFRRLGPLRNVRIITAYLRFLLRSGRLKDAAQVAEQSIPNDPSHSIWPYLSITWRLLGDPRWQMLEGDPRLVGVYDIADRLPPLDALAERLRALHRSSQHPLYQSLRGGTQTDGQLFHHVDPLVQALRRAVAEAVESHVAQLPPAIPGHPTLIGKRAPIAFAGSWSVRLSGGGRHVNHVHPLGWFSSALYIVVPGEAERGDGQAGWLNLGRFDELGLDLPAIRTIEPAPGRLVLFPSTMWHGTIPFAAGERLTVAFDVRRPG